MHKKHRTYKNLHDNLEHYSQISGSQSANQHLSKKLSAHIHRCVPIPQTVGRVGIYLWSNNSQKNAITRSKKKKSFCIPLTGFVKRQHKRGRLLMAQSSFYDCMEHILEIQNLEMTASQQVGPPISTHEGNRANGKQMGCRFLSRKSWVGKHSAHSMQKSLSNWHYTRVFARMMFRHFASSS